jgi:small GTP-binding protein
MRAPDHTAVTPSAGITALAALAALEALADGPDRDLLAALAERLQAARLRVLVIGEAKRGKSTLANALLGREVLPTGVTPLTALATTVTCGDDEHLEVAFSGGGTERFPLAMLADFATERGNPANRRHVAAVTVRLDAPILARGVEIVDTPGTGSVHAHNSAAADSVLPTMDTAIFVLTADPPVSASERELLGRVARLSVTTFVVLNKADYLTAAELAEAMDFTARIAREAVGQDVRVYPLSARTALRAGGDAGYDAFAADFLAYLDTGRLADLQRSVAAQLRRLAASLLDEVTLAQRAAQLRGSAADGRVSAFTARLAAVSTHSADAQDRAAAQSGRLLTALNAAAEQERRRLAADLGNRIGMFLASDLAAAQPAEIERQGRARLAGLVAEAAESWRQAQREILEAGLQRLDRRLADELEAELAAVRTAASELLGVELTLPGPERRLAADQRFFYTLGEHVDQAELLAGAVRRRLPGELGRRLARDHVLGQIAALAGSQIGRARADLQYRLAEATRQLTADVRRRYRDSTDRLAAALESAARSRGQTAAEVEIRHRELSAREQALRAVLAALASLR